MTTLQHMCPISKFFITSETAQKPSQSTTHEESGNGGNDRAGGAEPLCSALRPEREKTASQPASAPLGPPVVGLPRRVESSRVESWFTTSAAGYRRRENDRRHGGSMS